MSKVSKNLINISLKFRFFFILILLGYSFPISTIASSYPILKIRERENKKATLKNNQKETK